MSERIKADSAQPADSERVGDDVVAALAGMVSIEDSVTQGQERERRNEWLPKARAALAAQGQGEAVACPHHVRYPHPCRECEDAKPADSGRVGDDLVAEGLDYFERGGDAGDKLYVEAIRAALAAQGQGEAVAWLVTRDHDRTFPHVYISESSADAVVEWVTLPPFANKVPLYTTPPASPAGVPDGWVLVPREPTSAMQAAHHIYGDTSDWWNAVIEAAAPSAPESNT